MFGLLIAFGLDGRVENGVRTGQLRAGLFGERIAAPPDCVGGCRAFRDPFRVETCAANLEDNSKSLQKAADIRDFSLTDSLLMKLHCLEGWTLKEAGAAFGELSETSMCIRKKNLIRRLRERFAPHMLTDLKERAA